MIKALMHDPIFFAVKSEPATKDDLQTTQNLLDTLIALKDSRVGIAANMISVKKCIITFLDENGLTPIYTVMLNPEIIKKAVHTTPRMDVYLSSVIQGLANAINPSRSSIKPWNCRLISRLTQVGQCRLYNMKWITAMVF